MSSAILDNFLCHAPYPGPKPFSLKSTIHCSWEAFGTERSKTESLREKIQRDREGFQTHREREKARPTAMVAGLRLTALTDLLFAWSWKKHNGEVARGGFCGRTSTSPWRSTVNTNERRRELLLLTGGGREGTRAEGWGKDLPTGVLRCFQAVSGEVGASAGWVSWCAV